MQYNIMAKSMSTCDVVVIVFLDGKLENYLVDDILSETKVSIYLIVVYYKLQSN